MDTEKPHYQNNLHVNNDSRSLKLKSNGSLGLNEVLLSEIKSLYYMEKVVLKAFPKIMKNACSYKLIEASTIYIEKTKLRLIRIEESFTHLNEALEEKKHLAIDSILKEADDIIEDTKFGNVRDIGIMLSFHKIVHLKIAVYKMLSEFSELANQMEIAKLFAESLNEEKVSELRNSKIISSIRLDSVGN